MVQNIWEKIRERKKSQQECVDFSVSVPEGLLWTWNKKTKMCFVKKSNAGKRKNAEAVSGNRKCGTDEGSG